MSEDRDNEALSSESSMSNDSTEPTEEKELSGNGASELNSKLSFWNRIQVPAPFVAIIVLVSLISGDAVWGYIESFVGFKRPPTESEVIVECVNRARKVDEKEMSDKTFRMVINKVCSPPTLVVVEEGRSK